MKKYANLLLFCFGFLLILLNNHIVYSGDLEIDDQTIMDDEEVTFSVSINNAPTDLSDIQFDIRFDKEVLSYNNEFDSGELVSDFTSFDVGEIDQGLLRVEGLSTEPIPTGSTGILTQIKFNVNLCSETTLELDNLVLDLQGLSTKNGTLTCNEIEALLLLADFDANLTEGIAPLEVQFTDKSESETDIFFWAWDFGDGNSSIDQNPVHTYQNSGLFSVALTVFASADPNDLNAPAFKATATKVDIINVIPNEIAKKANLEVRFAPNPVQKLSPDEDKWLYRVSVMETNGIGVTITNFQVTNEEGEILTDEGADTFVAWFDDCGAGSTGFIPGFGIACGNVVSIDQEFGLGRIWNFSGIDENGNDVTTSGKIMLSPTSVLVNFSATPTSGRIPLQVQFTDNSESNVEILSWEWGFGDGRLSKEQNPSHTYQFPGRYNVSLKVSALSNESDPNSVTLDSSTIKFDFIIAKPLFPRKRFKSE